MLQESSPSNLCWTFTNVFRHMPWKLEEEQLAMCRKAVTGFFYGKEKDLPGTVGGDQGCFVDKKRAEGGWVGSLWDRVSRVGCWGGLALD